LVFAGFQAPAFSTALTLGFLGQGMSAAIVTADQVRPEPDRDTPVQVLVDGHGLFRQAVPPAALFDLPPAIPDCHRVVLVRHAFGLDGKHKVQVPPVARSKCRAPRSCAGTENFALNSAMYFSRRNWLAPSRVVMPATRSSCGSRFCHVPKFLSDRPRASGE